jgi:hypothetical protein
MKLKVGDEVQLINQTDLESLGLPNREHGSIVRRLSHETNYHVSEVTYGYIKVSDIGCWFATPAFRRISRPTKNKN